MTSTTSRLLLFLHTSGKSLENVLPIGHMPIFPFYTTVSRLTYKPDAFNCKSIAEPFSEIISVKNHQLSFADVCNNRSLEIRKLKGNIYILWSGGIDSTCVIASILKNWSEQDLERATVLCNHYSVLENRQFFAIISKKFKTKLSTHRYEDYLKKGYVITGELGDQLFGSDVVGECVKHWGDDVIHADWTDIAPKIFQVFSPNFGMATYNNYRGIIDEAPFKLKTVHDFFWWLNITQKWQHVKLRTLISSSWEDPKTYFPKLIHFYETVDFQVWSLHNQDKKIKSTWDSYKYTAKNYIVDYTRDEKFHTKLKLPSLRNLHNATEFKWAIDEDWKYLTREESLLRLRDTNDYRPNNNTL